MQYAHLFGPVRSRRLGSSLGVDLVPFKTCNCNCIYCECGGAPSVSHRRAEYIPASELISELEQYLNSIPPIDVVTFAGSGEPTLNTALGPVIRFVKNRFPGFKTALLTNGTLFHLREVRDEVLTVDLVLPSLDAVSPEVFHRVNRPCRGLDVRKLIDGLIAFSSEYKGDLRVEIFIVPGVNDTPAELVLFKDVLLKIRPTRVQLNSLDRPGPCEWVTTATVESLQMIAEYFRPLPVEIISRNASCVMPPLSHPENLDGTIRRQLQRRPATLEEIAVLCSAAINEIQPVLNDLTARHFLETDKVNGRLYYRVT